MTRAALLAMTLFASPAMAASPIEGSWTNPQRSVTVRIAPCRAGTLCGRVTSASPQARADAAKGGTPRLIGTELMSGLQRTGEHSWRGSIFVPDVNRTAEAEFRMVEPRTVSIQGCALGGLLCRSQEWTKVTTSARRRRR